MMKRLFALATMTALTAGAALVAGGGCSSEGGSSNQATGDAGDAGRGREAPSFSDRDAGPTEEAPTSCMAEGPIDATKFPYKKAGVTKDACTPAEADEIASYFAARADHAEDIEVSEWQKEVSPECAACVFSDGSGATWTPILSKNDRLDTVDRGGCIEAVSGSEDCGRAYQQVNECRLAACLPADQGGVGRCAVQGEFEACLGDGDAIFTGPCKDAYEAMVSTCGEHLGEYEDACAGQTYTFEGPIKVMCTGESAGDAGAGGDDAVE